MINDVKEQNIVFANNIKPQTQRSSVRKREGRGDNSNPNFIINTGVRTRAGEGDVMKSGSCSCVLHAPRPASPLTISCLTTNHSLYQFDTYLGRVSD